MLTFDTSKSFEVILDHISPEKRCSVRYPTDAEWCERSRRRRVVRHLLSGKMVQVADNIRQLNVEMFEKIRLIDQVDPGLTEREITDVIDDLEVGRIASVTREGGLFRITFATLVCETVHVLRAPTIAEMDSCERKR
jgi:hypothetical protein